MTLLCFRCLNHECEHPDQHRLTEQGQNPPRHADTIYDCDAVCVDCLRNLRSAPVSTAYHHAGCLIEHHSLEEMLYHSAALTPRATP